LLASRLPDRSILLGKIIPPVLIGWGTGLIFPLLSLVIVNFAHSDGGVLFYNSTITFGILALSFFSSTVMAAGGVLTSLSSETVQDSTQKLMAFIMVPAVLIQVVPILFREQVAAIIGGMDGQQYLIIAVLILAIMDFALYAFAFARFQRSKAMI
jgi:hypothetical protein